MLLKAKNVLCEDAVKDTVIPILSKISAHCAR